MFIHNGFQPPADFMIIMRGKLLKSRDFITNEESTQLWYTKKLG